MWNGVILQKKCWLHLKDHLVERKCQVEFPSSKSSFYKKLTRQKQQWSKDGSSEKKKKKKEECYNPASCCCFFFFLNKGLVLLFYITYLLGINVALKRARGWKSGLLWLAVLQDVKRVTPLDLSFHLCNVRGLGPRTLGFLFSVCFLWYVSL